MKRTCDMPRKYNKKAKIEQEQAMQVQQVPDSHRKELMYKLAYNSYMEAKKTVVFNTQEELEQWENGWAEHLLFLFNDYRQEKHLESILTHDLLDLFDELDKKDQAQQGVIHV